MRAKIMLIGLGDLGGVLLDLMLRMPEAVELVVGTRNLARDQMRCRLSQLAAEGQGSLSRVRAVALDLNDVGATAATLEKEAPELVLSTATMATWWLPDLLPKEDAQAIHQAGFGVWLPCHLAPTLLLMKAVRAANYRGHVLTAPYPDVVNDALGKVGLAPTCGIGNVAEIVAKIHAHTAQKIGCARNQIQISLVAHHALVHYAYAHEAWPVTEDIPPFLLSIRHEGKPITDEVDGRALLLAPEPIAAGRVTHILTASLTVPLVRAFMSQRPVALHAPGVHGLPGGYPVLVSEAGVVLNLKEKDREQAIATNQRAQRYDGIESVLSDGTVIMNEANAAQLRTLIGYCPTHVRLDEVQEQAAEIVRAYQEFANPKRS